MNCICDCVECFKRTGEYPSMNCGECPRYLADAEMSQLEIDIERNAEVSHE